MVTVERVWRGVIGDRLEVFGGPREAQVVTPSASTSPGSSSAMSNGNVNSGAWFFVAMGTGTFVAGFAGVVEWRRRKNRRLSESG
jgi:hypothetical protein